MDSVTQSWREIKTPGQIGDLMEVFGNFHDGCIREIHVETGDYVEEDLTMSFEWHTTVHMLVQRQGSQPSAVELRFEEVVPMRVNPPPPNNTAIIFRATFFSHEEVIYWSDYHDWRPELSDWEESTWISARRVLWRDASEWMGQKTSL